MRLYYYFFVVILSVSLLEIILADDSLLVSVKEGILRGILSKSRSGNEYWSFFGIPFAKPPIGNRRFEPPEKPNKWEGIRNASVLPQVCIQTDLFADPFNFNTNLHFGSEDCLYLNVFAPKNKTKHFFKDIPVLVFIHGGAYTTGSAAEYDPHYLMDNDIIFVTIQYRLNVFGFLSMADEYIPGNYGMKDQVAALKWIQNNIRVFGGDPNQVTIMGHSAGGASTHFHMYSHSSLGTFQRAISLSGSALAVWAQIPHKLARKRAQTIAVLTGCQWEPISEMKKCLQNLPADKLFYSSNKLFIHSIEPIVLFSVVVESRNVESAFLTVNPWTHDVVNNVPWMVGLVKNEGGIAGSKYLGNPKELEYFAENYERLLPITSFYGNWFNSVDTNYATNKIKKHYFNNEEISVKYDMQFNQLFSDSFFIFDCIESSQRHSNTTFLYLYDHRNKKSYNDFFGTYEKDLGICHADDLISLFRLPFSSAVIDDDLVVSERMVNYITNFVKFGNPNKIHNQIWKPIGTNLEYLHITSNMDSMDRNLFKNSHQFWKSIFTSIPNDLIHSYNNTHTNDEL